MLKHKKEWVIKQISIIYSTDKTLILRPRNPFFSNKMKWNNDRFNKREKNDDNIKKSIEKEKITSDYSSDRNNAVNISKISWSRKLNFKLRNWKQNPINIKMERFS